MGGVAGVRRPTPEHVALAWWRAAVGGDPVPYHLNDIEAGWFKTRLAYRGVWWPARIWIVAPTDPETGELVAEERFACEVAGDPADAHEQWPYLSKRPVSLIEYQQLCEERGIA